MTLSTSASRTQSASPSAGQLVANTLRRRRQLTMLTVWALVGALPTFASGQAIARAVDHGFLAGRPAIGLLWLGLLAATVPAAALGARQTYLGVAGLVEPLRDHLVRMVVRGALWRSSWDMEANGDAAAVTRLTRHVEAVRETVAGLLLLLLGFVGAVVAALAGMTTLTPVVLPLVVVPLVASAGAFVASLPALTRQHRRLLLADENLAETAGGTIEGLRDVVACGGEEVVTSALDGRIDDHVAAGRSMARVTATRTVIVTVGGRLPVVLVLLAAPWLMRRGLTEGQLLGTLTYLIQGLEPAVASVVDGVVVPLAQLSVTVRRIDDGVRSPVPPGRPDPPGPAEATGTAASADLTDGNRLVLRDVTFRYRADAQPVVDGLHLDVPDGDHLAVVGPSGAGKSTLAALLVGVLRPQAGQACCGELAAADVAPARRVLVPQHAYVFRGTLDENLRYLRPDAGREELDRAVAAVGAEPLVERVGGYEAVIDPGALSMGERQLITLARAYAAPARLMVLDEATCHLDPAAEAQAEQAFAARPGTLVVVAHRISSARRARHILLMDGPRTELGSHDELLDRSPRYRELVGHWLDPSAP